VPKFLKEKDIRKPGRSRSRPGTEKNPTAWTEMEGRTAYRQHMVFWSRAQHHMTTSLMKLAVGERNVATNLGRTPGCVVEYCFSIVAQNSWKMYQSKLSCLCWLVVCGQVQLRTSVTKPVNIDSIATNRQYFHRERFAWLTGSWQYDTHRTGLASYCQLPVDQAKRPFKNAADRWPVDCQGSWS